MKMFNSCRLYKSAPPAVYNKSYTKLPMKLNCNKGMPLQPLQFMELRQRVLSEIFWDKTFY